MKAPASLCPGYKQVESFGPDEAYEDEEEVCYVTLDMGNVEPTLVPSSSFYRLIGLDTPTPFIQLQGTILKGRHDMLLGTELIFTDDKESHDWNRRSVAHVANTEQRIAFQEVTLIPKLSKGKEKADGETGATFEPPAGDNSGQIDRMTGVSGPPARAPRTRKATSDAKSTSKRKGKQLTKASRKSTSSLPMLTPQPSDVASTSGEKIVVNDEMDDMYMDTE